MIDLRSGSDRGRIYRVYRDENKPRPIPDLHNRDTAQLVAALDSPSGWQRDTAQRLLIHRGDPTAVEPLAKLLETSANPKARLHALCALDGLGKLRLEQALTGMRDPHPGVREHAIRVSEALLHSGQGQALGEALNRLVDDPEIRVRRQLAFSLGEWNSPVAGTLLARLTNRAGGEPELQTAIASSAVGHSVPILDQLFSGPHDTEKTQD
ncbi:MAG: hypothetical protein CM1200mP34_5280 [Verrucomicrobiales bacterium]|nr:MAG: hypothetical protein CM1200mP34_5280 [Verrucomicrobiales bacterium]